MSMPTGSVEVASAAVGPAVVGAGIGTVGTGLTPAVEVAGAALAPVAALPRAGAGEVMESTSGKFLLLLALFAMAQLVLAGLIRMVTRRRAEVEDDGIVGI